MIIKFLPNRDMNDYEYDCIDQLGTLNFKAYHDRKKSAESELEKASRALEQAKEERLQKPRYVEIQRLMKAPQEEMSAHLLALGDGDAQLGMKRFQAEWAAFDEPVKAAQSAYQKAQSAYESVEGEQDLQHVVDVLHVGERIGFIMGVRHMVNLLQDPQTNATTAFKLMELLNHPDQVDALVARVFPNYFPHQGDAAGEEVAGQ